MGSRDQSANQLGRSASRSRQGVAAVEFAVCLPLIVTIVLASIEASSMVYLKSCLQTTAYEAARIVTAPNGTPTMGIDRGHEILSQCAVVQGAVQISPSNSTSLVVGQQVAVTLTAPVSANRIIGPWFFNSGNLSARCVFVKEGS